MGLFAKREFEYSGSFFRNASDEELDIEREKVRVKRNSSYNDREYNKFERLLNKFDNVIINRANVKWEKEHHNVDIYRSEHGWYLPEDDD